MRLLTEIQHAARSLARAPLLVVIAAGSLALGIGANATIFNFVNAVEFRPLPFPEPDRLVDVALWAALVPARRAARIDPLTALRSQ